MRAKNLEVVPRPRVTCTCRTRVF